MSLRSFLFVSVLFTAFSVQSFCQEKEVKSQIVSLGLFKNGICLVQERIPIPGEGTFYLSNPASPIHGTFFMENNTQGDMEITASSVEREIDVPLAKAGKIMFPDDFIGKKVRLYYTKDDSFIAQFVRIESESTSQFGLNRGNEYYTRMPATFSSSSLEIQNELRTSSDKILLIKETGEQLLVSLNQFNAIELAEKDALKTVLRKKNLLLFKVKKNQRNTDTVAAKENKSEENKSEEKYIQLSYLTYGISWMPNYHIRLMDSNTMRIEQTAIIRNEWRSLFNTDFTLISGFPQIQFQNTPSPMAPQITLAQFFNALSQYHPQSQPVVMQQAVMMNSISARPNDVSFSLPPSSITEGPDLYFQEIGKREINVRETSMFSVCNEMTSYNNIICWNIPYNRNVDGTLKPFDNNNNNSNGNNYASTVSGSNYNQFQEPWDVISFNNPFKFPITTGPVSIFKDNRFYGQNTLYWSNPSEEVLLPVNKALSIRVSSTETERETIAGSNSTTAKATLGLPIQTSSNAPSNFVQTNTQPEKNNSSFVALPPWNPDTFDKNANPDKLSPEELLQQNGNFVMIYNSRYRIALIDSVITIQNQRNKLVSMKINHQVVGDMLWQFYPRTGKRPDDKVLTTTSNINRCHELSWSFNLAPGEKKTITFTRRVFVRL